MYNFVEKFDGTDRTPRQIQIDALNWLSENWDKNKLFVMNAPLGSGKSALARAIQLKTDAFIVTPSNMLVDQYRTTYPNVNYLIGKRHYKCHTGMSCSDWVEIVKQKPCTNCPYVECKRKAVEKEATFFNPISLFYLNKQPNVLVIDEAHQLESMLLLLCGVSFSQDRMPFDASHLNELRLIKFLKIRSEKVQKLINQYKNDVRKVQELIEEYEHMKFTILGLEEDAQNYAIWIEDKVVNKIKKPYLNIKPLKVPQSIIKQILSANKIIMMSGTISEFDVKDLMGEETKFAFLELDSPIPKENRLVNYKPIPIPVNKDTDPQVIVNAIESIIKDNPGQNTIVHMTYSMSNKLVPYFKIPVLYNESNSDKLKILEKFKLEGGVLIAAGMAEGIDLPGDLCRVNIIPKLLYPNMGDQVVKKRLALTNGSRWFDLFTLKQLVQQTGRSTRGPDDFSKTFVLDPQFPRLFNKNSKYLPKYFRESVVWTST